MTNELVNRLYIRIDFNCYATVRYRTVEVIHNNEPYIESIEEVRVYPVGSLPFNKLGRYGKIKYIDNDDIIRNNTIIFMLCLGVLLTIVAYGLYQVLKPSSLNAGLNLVVNKSVSMMGSKQSRMSTARSSIQMTKKPSVYMSSALIKASAHDMYKK